MIKKNYLDWAKFPSTELDVPIVLAFASSVEELNVENGKLKQLKPLKDHLYIQVSVERWDNMIILMQCLSIHSKLKK